MHLACAKNDRSLCALLVAGGADASVMNMSNETPPQLASSQEIRQLFEDAVKAKKGLVKNLLINRKSHV